MVGIAITKEIVTNVVIKRIVTEIEVVDISSSECIIEKLARMLSGLILRCIIKI